MMNRSNVNFLYGAPHATVDVTETASQTFISGNRLKIPKSTSFNALFGDVAPHRAKTLQICFKNDNTRVVLAETRFADYALYVSADPDNIPKRIIQYCHESDEAGVIEATKTLRALHSTFQYEMYNRSEASKFIENNCEANVVMAFRKCNDYVMQRNLFCYCYLYILGGIFVDCNTSCRRRCLEELIPNNVELVLSRTDNGLLRNEFIAAQPLSLVMRKAIDACVANVANETYSDVSSTVGNAMLAKQCVAVYGEDYVNNTAVHVLTQHQDCPLRFTNLNADIPVPIYSRLDLRSLLRVDNVFVLNLEKRTDRMQQCCAEFKKLSVEDAQWERFNAFVGADADVQQRFKNVFTRFAANVQVSTIGAFGCLLSHYHMIKAAKERGYKRLLLLEDDFEALLPFTDSQLLTTIGECKCDMFYLSMTIVLPPLPTADPRICRVNRVVSTGAYLISHTIFDFVLDNCLLYAREIDVFYADVVQRNFNVLCVPRSIIVQRDSYSDIAMRHVSYFGDHAR
jgi:hypothetical protein